MTPIQNMEAKIIIDTNTKKNAIKQLVEGGYCTTANKASKLYFKVRRLER